MQKRMKGIIKWIGLCVCILSLAYFFDAALEQISSLPPVRWSSRAYLSATCAITLNCLVILFSGYAWLLLLRACGEIVRAIEAFIIFSLSQFAKYIPGNVAHHAGRIVLACNQGLNIFRVTFTMIIEVTWITVAAFILIIILLILGGDTYFNSSQEPYTLFQLAMAASIAIFSFGIIWSLVRWRPGPIQKVVNPSFAYTPSSITLIYCLLIYILCFLLMGIASDILIRGLFDITTSRIGLLTGAFAIAWTAGFITPGAPAGLGVRETILLKILAPIYGPGIAVAFAVALRVVSILADGFSVTVALFAQRRIKSFPHKPPHCDQRNHDDHPQR